MAVLTSKEMQMIEEAMIVALYLQGRLVAFERSIQGDHFHSNEMNCNKIYGYKRVNKGEKADCNQSNQCQSLTTSGELFGYSQPFLNILNDSECLRMHGKGFK